VDLAEWRFAQQKESLKRKGPAAVLRSKNRINSNVLFFVTFFWTIKRKLENRAAACNAASKISEDEMFPA
jgi:hypothetical protein